MWKKSASIMACCLGVTLSGCASTAMDRLMPRVETMSVARHYFGEATSVRELADGGTRSEWILDRTTQIPGQDVEQTIFVGRDRDGYIKRVTRTVFVPAHMVRQYCRLTIIADKNGRVLESSWHGDSCDALPVVPLVQ